MTLIEFVGLWWLAAGVALIFALGLKRKRK
jgi:hypothetical protein